MFIVTAAITDWILPIGLGLLVGFFIATRKSVDPDAVIYLSAEEFRQNMRKGQLIDIRPVEDFKKEKINGSRNFPKREVMGNLSKLRADQAVFLYSSTGKGKIKTISKKLAKKGFKPVYVLKDGFDEWPFIKK